jgi:hypothetical protein
MHTGNYLVKYLSIFARSTLLVLMFSWAGAQASPDAVTRAPWSAFAHTSFRHHPVSAGGVFTQDNSGFVWLGTQSGLVRWDGYRMRRYVANPADPRALRDGYILSLHIDAGGRSGSAPARAAWRATTPAPIISPRMRPDRAA